MIFETERLIVTKWKQDDFEELHELYNDAALMETITSQPSVEETRFIFENQITGYSSSSPFGRYFIIEKQSNKFIGILLFKKDDEKLGVEIGYSIKKKHWKKGYATEVVKESIHWIFESKGFASMYAITASYNENSKKVLRKCGFLPGENFIESGEEMHLFDLQREDISTLQ